MPNGVVEADIYNALEQDKLLSFTTKNRKIEPREGAEPYNPKRYGSEFYHRIKNAVEDLRKKNENLVLLHPFEISGLTSWWSAWGRAIAFAEFMGRYSARMPVDSIRESSRVFDFS